MKLKVCPLLFFGLAISDANIQSKCEHQAMLEADQCAKKGFFLFNPDWEGNKENSVDDYCGPIKHSSSCVQRFIHDCLKGEISYLARLGLDAMKRHHQWLCPSNAREEKQNFLQRTKWITKKEIGVIYSCVQASITNMDLISNNTFSSNPEKRIPLNCCNYRLTRSCLSKKMEKLTTEENKKYAESSIDLLLTSLINYACQKKWNSTESCEKDVPGAMGRMAATFKNLGPKPKMESFLIPFLDSIYD